MGFKRGVQIRIDPLKRQLWEPGRHKGTLDESAMAGEEEGRCLGDMFDVIELGLQNRKNCGHDIAFSNPPYPKTGGIARGLSADGKEMLQA